MLESIILAIKETHMLLIGLIIAVVIQSIAWLLQLKYKNADFVDIAWAFGVAWVASLYLFTLADVSFLFVALLIAPVIWYLRLASHLVIRFDAKEEDGRYQYLRNHWANDSSQNKVQFKFYLFFIFQAFLIWFFSLPVYLILEYGQASNAIIIISLVIIVTSLIGVTVSDNQLHQFKLRNTGGVCKEGLWKYSRHPNYFFEWLHWCAYPLLGWHQLAISDPFWWLLLSYPLWMFLFLWKITGIPFNEEQNIRSKGDKYRQYQQTTNAFFPGKTREIKELS